MRNDRTHLLRRPSFRLVLALAGLVTVGAGSSQASPLVFQTAAGASGNDGPVSAKATFTFNTNTLTLVIENLQSSHNAAGQAISGIHFEISPAATGTAFTGGTGVMVNID